MDDNCREWMESMGVASGCGCKEVYRFPHTTYPYSSCICSFLQQYPYFLFIFKNVFRSLYIFRAIERNRKLASLTIIITRKCYSIGRVKASSTQAVLYCTN